MARTPQKQLKYFIVDVDGVLTDGTYLYTAEGKVMKRFGPDDHDALLLLKDRMEVVFVTGDKRGLPITQKRIDDMKFPLHVVSTFERAQWIAERYALDQTAYMGDGLFDVMVFDRVAYGIAPANAFFKTKESADHVTAAKGGEGAVAEACWHLLKTFYAEPDIHNLTLKKGEGVWGK